MRNTKEVQALGRRRERDRFESQHLRAQGSMPSPRDLALF